jgi:hypothetical protein
MAVGLGLEHCLVLKQHEGDASEGPEGVCDDLDAMLTQGTGADVKFILADKEIPAHKVILCARSEYFRSMFCGPAAAAGMSEASGGTSGGMAEVRVNECDAATFEQLLRWIYTGRADLNGDAAVGSLACLADRYRLMPLRRVCARNMRECLNGENCMQFWEHARRCGDTLLQACCFRAIVDHYDKLRMDPEFKRAMREHEDFLDSVLQMLSVKRPVGSGGSPERKRARGYESPQHDD